jgi:hypothetical protein
MALSTTVMIESTAIQKKWDVRNYNDEPLHYMNGVDEMKRTGGGQVYQDRKSDVIPSRIPDDEASINLSD